MMTHHYGFDICLFAKMKRHMHAFALHQKKSRHCSSLIIAPHAAVATELPIVSLPIHSTTTIEGEGERCRRTKVRINEIEQSKVIKKRMSQLSSTTDFAPVLGKRDYGMMDRAGDDDGLESSAENAPRYSFLNRPLGRA